MSTEDHFIDGDVFGSCVLVASVLGACVPAERNNRQHGQTGNERAIDAAAMHDDSLPQTVALWKLGAHEVQDICSPLGCGRTGSARPCIAAPATPQGQST